MDAVLPLTARDLGRARILLRSLHRFFEDLGRVFVLVPDHQHAEIKAQLWVPEGLRIELLPETEIAPELASLRRRGWYKQQVLKLAVFEHVQSPFYLTLDADVVATRIVSADRLTPGGRALSYVIPRDLHPTWYRDTARFLGGGPLVRGGIVHNVTPAVLSRTAVQSLALELQRRAETGRWSKGLAGWRQRWSRSRGRQGWRDYLVAGLPWTEYALYYSFLELAGTYAEHHVETDRCIYDIDRSLWKNDAPRFEDGWQPEELFAGEGPPYFVVLQSNSGIPAEDIETRLAPYLD